MQRSFLDYLVITLKGIAMGAADVVPGVSGGTIAFISGIYEELITSINNISLETLQLLRKEGFKKAWQHINGNFLAALFLGIAISVLSLAKLLEWLLEHHPILLWSFFFGLVVASIFFVGKQISKWSIGVIIAFIIGAALAYYITTIPPSHASGGYLYLFFAGALAICAMILPGISGAFILVLLGAYGTVLAAVNNRDLITLAIVGLGAVFGLLSFSRLLKYLFTNYKNSTLALLTGFILGSLNKIWPWKEIMEIEKFGDKTITIDRSISPFYFDGDPKLMWAIILAFIGFLTIFLLEKLATVKE
ncbi:DUF368 domain-containing protein [Galbibacter pacificus]|uniref:DUF368 domain-containing protein n=1 Tax=Galbibacter pacificus TaxID=2996052 RepID=A0ABT6FNE1_9FLAO|nr:DUF368 domain-containing protein [Galbibacter pacificus]MDG3581312.1 DUF368 domain-containing protein [Galbibacter pacificus]MDG3584790.1 DUF368 domain-containing protein [Galbibacter pacificus]